MPHHSPLVSTIVVGLVLAFALGAIAHRLKASPLVGYLLAGVIIGPFTPGFVADQAIANELAEIGIILLMFGVGLQFSLHELLSVRAIAVPGAIVQIAVATALGAALAWLLGWSLSAGLIFGAALSVASTVVVLRTLQERRLLDTERGRIAVGWLIVEDLAMVLVLVLLPVLADFAQGENVTFSALALPLAVTLGKFAAFVVLMWLVGRRVIPWLSALRGAYRLARAVPPRRAGDRARRRLWGRHAVRRLVRARRVLRRHDPERVDAEPARRPGDAAAARRLRGAVLRLGRHAVQSGRDPEPSAVAARDLADHHGRQVGGRVFRGAAVPPFRIRPR